MLKTIHQAKVQRLGKPTSGNVEMRDGTEISSPWHANNFVSITLLMQPKEIRLLGQT